MASFTTVLVSLFLAIASSDEKTADPATPPAENVAAAQIFKDFAENEVAAKAKYGDKVIAVRGIVASIENNGGGAIVLLNDGNAENVGVRCYFNEDQVKSTAELKKGSPVKIIGIGSTSLTIDYKLSGCRLGELGDN